MCGPSRMADPSPMIPTREGDLRSASSPRVGFRARALSPPAEGMENVPIAQELRTGPHPVLSWRRRFLLLHLPGIEQAAPRFGRPPEEDPAHPTPRGGLWVRPDHGPRGGGASFPGPEDLEVAETPPASDPARPVGQGSEVREKTIDGSGHRPPPPDGAGSCGSKGRPRRGRWSGAGHPSRWGKDGPEGRPHDSRRPGRVDLSAAWNDIEGGEPGVLSAAPACGVRGSAEPARPSCRPRPCGPWVVPTKLWAHTTAQVPGCLGRHPRSLFHIPRRVPHGPFGWRSG